MKRLYKFLMVTVLSALPFQVIFAQDSDDFLPDMQGRIAYIGLDRNLYVVNLEDDTISVLTDDSMVGRRYAWPVWSRDGGLSYFLMLGGAQTVTTEVYISSDGHTEGALVYAGDSEVMTYSSWSPQNCADGITCPDLGVLFAANDSSEDLRLNVIDVRQDEVVSGTVGQGAPFYYSWSPDGNRMIWHRNNESIDVYDVSAENVIQTLPYVPGWFHAPSWSPVDDRLLVGIRGNTERTTDIVIAADNQTQELAKGLTGLVAFAWSPDGRYVAYSDGQGPVRVINSTTGEVLTGSGVSGILAFFWSPDSKRIAYLTLASPPGSFIAQSVGNVKLNAPVSWQQQSIPDISWSVLDIESSVTRRYGAFAPTEEMWFMIFFFDQFGQSHRIWSPDSAYLVYSEVSRSNRSVVSLLNAVEENSVPLSIADGLFGIWSFD